MIDSFINAGIRKLNALIQRDDFKSIESVTNVDGVIVVSINFNDTKCTLNSFGRCDWLRGE
jgi:hypothetical protein